MNTQLVRCLLILSAWVAIALSQSAHAAAASLGVTNGIGPAPLVVDFTASGGTTYQWDFGDGATASGAATTLQHTYNQVGYFTVILTATDSGGSSTTQAVVHVTPTSDFTAPILSGFTVIARPSSAVISWTTNEPADATVSFGPDLSYGTSVTMAALTTAHSVTLTGLTPGRRYFFRNQSTDAGGNTGNDSSTGDPNRFFITPIDTTAPVITAVAATQSTSAATIAWTTNEQATSRVEYGSTSAYGSSASNGVLLTQHGLAMTGLTPGVWHYRVLSADAAGNESSSTDATVTMPGTADTTAPTISGVQVANISTNSARVTWTTNERANSRIDFGTSTAYGSTVTDNSVVTMHSAVLTGLANGTLYHYALTSADSGGNAGTSADATFTFAANSPPTASVSASGTSGAAPLTVMLSGSGSDSDGIAGYAWDLGDGNVASTASVTHVYAAIGFYTAILTVTDSLGASSSTSVPISVGSSADVTPPVISGASISATAITASSAAITWTTNEASTSQVEYSPNGGFTTLDATLTASHSVPLSNLAPNTTYTFYVYSRDAAGNLAKNGFRQFRTLTAPTDSTPPVISSVATTAVTSTGGTVTWSTNEPGDGQVEFGTTTSYGSFSALAVAFVTNHSVMLGGLTPATLYHLRVLSRDTSGNLATSGDTTFTTAAAQAAPPTFSPAAGTYAFVISVTIATTTPAATIRYTTDGSTPTPSTGTVYTGAIPVTANTTITAIAIAAGFTTSVPSIAVFTIGGTTTGGGTASTGGTTTSGTTTAGTTSGGVTGTPAPGSSGSGGGGCGVGGIAAFGILIAMAWARVRRENTASDEA